MRQRKTASGSAHADGKHGGGEGGRLRGLSLAVTNASCRLGLLEVPGMPAGSAGLGLAGSAMAQMPLQRRSHMQLVATYDGAQTAGVGATADAAMASLRTLMIACMCGGANLQRAVYRYYHACFESIIY
jgi:hypothetical protein